MISPLKRGVDSDVEPVEMTGKTCEKGCKIVFFGGNGVVRISTLQEKLLLISPVRLILYTDTLILFFAYYKFYSHIPAKRINHPF